MGQNIASQTKPGHKPRPLQCIKFLFSQAVSKHVNETTTWFVLGLDEYQQKKTQRISINNTFA